MLDDKEWYEEKQKQLKESSLGMKIILGTLVFMAVFVIYNICRQWLASQHKAKLKNDF